MNVSIRSHRANIQQNCNLDQDVSNSKAQRSLPNTRSSPWCADFVCSRWHISGKSKFSGVSLFCFLGSRILNAVMWVRGSFIIIGQGSL